MKNEEGFTLIEVAVASIIVMVGLIFLASLFTLAIAQNKGVKQTTAATMLAQQKLEELNAIERTDARLIVGGDLAEATKKPGYSDRIYVDSAGTVTTNIPQGETASYHRYWKIEPDTRLPQAMIITVRVVAAHASRGRAIEETTLTTVRSW